jgi:hypothetical protein
MPLPYVDPSKPALLTREQFKSSLGPEKGQRERVLAHDKAQREELEAWKHKFYGLVAMLGVYKREVEHIQRELTMIEECFAKQIEDNPVPDGY